MGYNFQVKDDSYSPIKPMVVHRLGSGAPAPYQITGRLVWPPQWRGTKVQKERTKRKVNKIREIICAKCPQHESDAIKFEDPVELAAFLEVKDNTIIGCTECGKYIIHYNYPIFENDVFVKKEDGSYTIITGIGMMGFQLDDIDLVKNEPGVNMRML